MANPDVFIPTRESSLAFFAAVRQDKFCDAPLVPDGGFVFVEADGTRAVIFAAHDAFPDQPQQGLIFQADTGKENLKIRYIDMPSNTPVPLKADLSRRTEMIALLSNLQSADPNQHTIDQLDITPEEQNDLLLLYFDLHDS
ncbi:MAG: hypothetical protein AAB557_02655 [Patescibacteria group bacterium]